MSVLNAGHHYTHNNNHNYRRSFPIRYNQTNSSTSLIVDKNDSFYVYPIGTLFLVVSTAGASEHDFLGLESYIVTQFKRFGFLNADVLDNRTKMFGTFMIVEMELPRIISPPQKK